MPHTQEDNLKQLQNLDMTTPSKGGYPQMAYPKPTPDPIPNDRYPFPKG